VALNKDPNTSRTIRVETGFPPHTKLQDFANHAAAVATDGASMVTLPVPENANGLGYVCYARPGEIRPFVPRRKSVNQDYEGAADLDLKPALENQRLQICRAFADAATRIEARLFDVDKSHWTPATLVEVEVEDPDQRTVAAQKYGRLTADSASLGFEVRQKGFHTFFVTAKNTPATGGSIAFRLNITYSAPQVV
jgi:alpha-amylase